MSYHCCQLVRVISPIVTVQISIFTMQNQGKPIINLKGFHADYSQIVLWYKTNALFWSIVLASANMQMKGWYVYFVLCQTFQITIFLSNMLSGYCVASLKAARLWIRYRCKQLYIFPRVHSSVIPCWVWRVKFCFLFESSTLTQAACHWFLLQPQSHYHVWLHHSDSLFDYSSPQFSSTIQSLLFISDHICTTVFSHKERIALCELWVSIKEQTVAIIALDKEIEIHNSVAFHATLIWYDLKTIFTIWLLYKTWGQYIQKYWKIPGSRALSLHV